MLLNDYKANNLLFYSNFLETTSSGELAYRGDLVITPGEPGDEQGHSKPPKDLLREALLLGKDKLTLFVGALDKMESLPLLLEKYQADFAPQMKAIIYVVNLKSAVQVEIAGINFVLIPMVQGVPWNETLEELALEKSHFKGMSPADKLETLFDELQSYQPKYPAVTLEEALTFTNDAVREIHGAV